MADVIIEQELVFEHKPLGIAESTEFSRYRGAGGKLPEEVYNEAQGALQDNYVTRREFHEPTILQAQNFATKFRFTLTPKQTFLYCYLSEREKPPFLGDVKVFAEALLLTKDSEKYSKFTSAFPNIFEKQ